MTFQTEQNLIFAIMLGVLVLVALGYSVLSVYKTKNAAPNDKPYYMLAVLLSALVAAFMGLHLWQVLSRF